MTVYIALIRGINVGGKNKVPMAELREAYEQIGLTQVKTYIQSGNVALASELSAEELRPQLEKAILDRFGIAAAVAVRTAAEWDSVMARCPYDAQALQDKQTIQVAFLTEPLSAKALDVLETNKIGPDKYTVTEAEIYFFFSQSMLDSKLANSLQKIGKTMTMRNWNTVVKLEELSRTISG
ncbi:DUF1697 domain-containing protein [Cohnella cellulosilytica]|uniref:DUF1697 domain-containing protein n=1 Tax=Cohnella cellulosilytica TaxID=986710 RepID=A0ABW2FJS5_9BACL